MFKLQIFHFFTHKCMNLVTNLLNKKTRVLYTKSNSSEQFYLLLSLITHLFILYLHISSKDNT